MPNPRRPEAETTRQAILHAAAQCFAAAGYSGTSMHDIATAAGVTQSLIHHYFEAKDALWRAVTTSTLAGYHGALEAALGVAEGPTREAMAAFFAHLAEHPQTLRMIAWVELEDTREIVSAPAALAGARQRIAAAQRGGRIRGDMPPEHVLTAFTGLLRTWFSDRNLVQDEGDEVALARVDAQYLDAAWAIFCGGAVHDRDA